MLAADETFADWLQLIRSEYFEIPDLHLTKRQAQQLWGLDPGRCDSLLDALVDTKFLRRTRDDGYVRDEAE
jgi:hypothetical protein